MKKLQGPKVEEIFNISVGGKFVALNMMSCDVDSRRKHYSCVTSTVQKVLVQQRKKKQSWVTKGNLHLYDQRMRLKKQRKGSLNAAFEYKAVNSDISKWIKAGRKKEQYAV